MGAFRYRLSNYTEPRTVEEYRRAARRAVPGMVWAFVDYGAEDLRSLEANRCAFDRYMFRTRVLTGNNPDDIGVTVAGSQLSLPVLFGPTGLAGLSHWSGELGAARAAERSGSLSVLSTASSYSLEEVAAGTDRNHFFQLYPWKNARSAEHDLISPIIDRAQRAGYAALFVTVDVPVIGNRERELNHGMGNPPIITPRRVLESVLRPRWSAQFLQHRRFTARSLESGSGARAAVRSLDTFDGMMRPELAWEDFERIRKHWDGPLFIKGVLDADDAEIAVDIGATGVVVSNHGGRQLDGAVAALDALPAIAERVGRRAEVLLDGGIRRGSDVIKALCLGADAVCVGRPYLYGLAARGPAGAEHILSIFGEEITRCMTLMGVGKLSDLSPACLVPAGQPIPD